MRNLRTANAFKPAARTERVGSMNDVFRAKDRPEVVKTSIDLPADLHHRLRMYAVGHDMKLREIFVEALERYMD